MSGKSHPFLQRLMKEEHDFLYKLFCEKSGRKNRKTLNRASAKQVWLVLRLLFCIAVGHIPLSATNFRRLEQSKRKNSLRSLKNRMESFRVGGIRSTSERRKFILQFAVLYHYLFHDIFVEDS